MEQNTPEWFKIRSSYPTASDFDKLITPAKLEISKSLPAYVALKLAEKWTGGPLQSFGSGMMDQGSVRQEDALPWYAAEFDVTLDRPGFVTNGEGTAGCSPDALIVGMDRGLEAKCCEADTHAAYLINGYLPREHLLQVQGSMLVTGFASWDFLSYHKSFPPFVLTVFRDEKVCKALKAGLDEYWERFNAGWARLIEANGGEGPAPKKYSTTYGPEGEEILTLDDLVNSPAMNG